jgi:putative hydrolase of the HAD superfamily
MEKSGQAKIIEIIAFDADDTLWHNETLYAQAKEKFQQLLLSYRDPVGARQRLDEIEVVNIQYYGYGIKSFALSMIEAAIEITEGRIGGRELQQIIEITKDMMTAEVQLFESAEETLARLSAKHALMLITKGDYIEQNRKIDRSGLAKYFRYIEIVIDKTTESYRKLLAKYNIDPRRFLMVGNSLRSDILPVIEMGGQAVYVPYEHTWSHETVSNPDVGKSSYSEIEHLGQLPALVEGLNGSSDSTNNL